MKNKNIHILPTDKPSNLLFEKISNRYYTNSRRKENSKNVQNQNIYITSDEEIKEGDWVYCNERKLFGKVVEIQLAKFKSDTSMLYFEINNEEIWCKLFNCKKIILTTDVDLIKDGVQDIDDEFLEWFVKNPSCEEVDWFYSSLMKDYEYEIIIPKEEPNQVGIDWSGFPKSTQEKVGYVETKQETLEEAARNYAIKKRERKHLSNREFDLCQKDFIVGAKWQQERMYSEEEVISFLQQYRYDLSSGKTSNIGDTTKLWFTQFKNK